MELWLNSSFSPHFHLALMTTAMKYIHYNLKRLCSVIKDCFINVSSVQIKKLNEFSYLSSQPRITHTQALALQRII